MDCSNTRRVEEYVRIRVRWGNVAFIQLYPGWKATKVIRLRIF
jgi:hypothetical protein